MIDGMACYKKGFKGVAEHLNGKQSLSDYQKKPNKNIKADKPETTLISIFILYFCVFKSLLNWSCSFLFSIKIFSKQTLPNIADVFNFKLRRSLLGMSVC